MRSFFRFLTTILFFSFSLHPVGWYPPLKISGAVSDFSVSVSGTRLYFATETIPGGFKKNRNYQVILKVLIFDRGNISVLFEQKIDLPPAPSHFPLRPRFAVSGQHMVMLWQQTDFKSGGTNIRYRHSEDSGRSFRAETRVQSGAATAILPVLKAEAGGRFHLFFHQDAGSNHFTLMHAIGEAGVFSAPRAVVQNVSFIGRGIFFPEAVIRGKRIDVIYQNRREETLKDDLYQVTSLNSGLTFQSPVALTRNSYNDYSPSATVYRDALFWCWQSNPEKKWITFCQSENAPAWKAGRGMSEYLPVVAAAGDAAVVAWYDQGESPPGIEAVTLLNGKPTSLGIHDADGVKGIAKKPQLVASGREIFLVFLTPAALMVRRADISASAISLRSTTHPPGKVGGGEKVRFEWKVPSDPSGIDRYAYVVDNRKDSVPQIFNYSGKQKSLEFSGMEGGDYWLHLRYRDRAGNLSPVSHYRFIIDNTAPTTPRITSSTHQERVANSSRQVKFSFKSGDDSGVAGYLYAFSANRAEKLTGKSESGEVKFENVSPGVRFLRVQARDQAGNLSPIAVYQVEISASDQLYIGSNISDGILEGRSINFTIEDSSKPLSHAFVAVSAGESDPFRKGKKYSASGDGKISFQFAPAGLKSGLYAANLGVVYRNGERSEVKSFYFQREGGKDGSVALTKRTVDHTASKNTGRKSHRKAEPVRNKIPKVEDLAALIRPQISVVQRENDLLEVSFSVPQEYEPWLKGYAWHFGLQPERPTYEINSSGGPDYLYNLSSGTYWLSVRPVFSAARLNLPENYSWQKLSVGEKSGTRSVMWLIIAGAGVLLLAIGLAAGNRIYFYLSGLFGKE